MKQNGKEKKIVSIAVPFQQHSFRAARGFIESGILNSYYTSVYNDGKGIYKLLKKCLPNNLVKRMEGRNDPIISPYVKKYSEFYGLLYLAACRNKHTKKYTPQIRKTLFSCFGKHVASACIRENTKLVLSYDTQAYDLFYHLKKNGSSIIRVLDMASTSAIKIRQIIDEELLTGHPFIESLKRHDIAYSEAKCRDYREEMKLADYLLVPSEFVKASLLEIGIPEDRIIYLSHGVDIEMFSPHQKKREIGDRVVFLFVGRVEAAKGIYYILEAFKQLQELNVELIVVGDTMGQIEQLKSYAPNVRFLGLKRRDEMPQYYNEADVFILSSLWEGSSLSMLEALASGLPVIASKYSCAPEVVTEFKEGFVVEPRNIEQMKEKIKWFYQNSEKIPEMSHNARKKAEEYTWMRYGHELAQITEKIIDQGIDQV